MVCLRALQYKRDTGIYCVITHFYKLCIIYNYRNLVLGLTGPKKGRADGPEGPRRPGEVFIYQGDEFHVPVLLLTLVLSSKLFRVAT